ncbi:MAG: ABC transporter ATP-binding protein [Promethearchaeota archaeon]
MTLAVKTEGLWKTYGSGTPREVNAVQNVSIAIERGLVTALGGPSGSGKTTLLSMIGLLTRPSQGRLFLGQDELSTVSEVHRTGIRRNRIGFVFQAQYLIPQLTALENVVLPKLCTDTAVRDAELLAKEKLIALGMEHRLDFRVAELSGGEAQRVSIARSLMNSPEILIADEPSSSIEEELARDLLGMLRTMVSEEDLTVVVASHDPLVLNWADHVYRMHEGRIVEED